MPLANITKITPEERETLRAWVDQGAKGAPRGRSEPGGRSNGDGLGGMQRGEPPHASETSAHFAPGMAGTPAIASFVTHSAALVLAAPIFFPSSSLATIFLPARSAAVLL